MIENKQIDINSSTQRNALYAFVISYVLALVFAFLLRNVKPLDNATLGFSVIAISFLVSMATLVYYSRKGLGALVYDKGATKTRIVATDSVIILAFSVASTVAGIAIAIVFSRTFKEFIYDPFSFSFWIATAVAGWIYVYTSLSQRIAMKDVVNLIGFYLIGGVTLSAILNPNPQWWNESVSYLGMNQIPSAKFFNFCIIFSGALLLALASFIIGEFKKIHDRGEISDRYLTFYKVSFILAPIGLACVGLFPYGSSPLHSTLHNLSASLAFGLFGIVMATLYFSMKFLSKYFIRINYFLLALLVGGYGLYVIKYFSLAIVEIFAFAIISLWLVLFLSNVTLANDVKTK